MKEIKISIITVSYNSRETIIDTLKSVLKQNYRPLEYIIIDGKSSDGTCEVIEGYIGLLKEHGIEVTYISEKDNGISDAFNKGILLATGDIIGIINSDDKLAKNALSVLAENYEENFGVYCGDCITFSNQNKTGFVVKPDSNFENLKKNMTVYHPSTFVSKKVYQKYGQFDVNIKYCMDRELLLRFLVNGVKFKYVEAPLAWYREGGTNQKNFIKTLDENENISTRYGTSPICARLKRYLDYYHYKAWCFVQRNDLEKLVHKKNINEK